jgi:3-isopropylmalate/(R)-2-methylmalate dehydratase small subunit
MIVTGTVLPTPQANIDTDQIIPAHYLTTIDETGMGAHLLEGFTGGRDLIAKHAGASIWVAGENVGCGSSREHAVWALTDAGFKAVIAPSFARIFHDNCYMNGVVPVIVDEKHIPRFAAANKVTLDIAGETVQADDDPPVKFELDPARKPFVLGGGFLKYLAAKIPAIRRWEAARDHDRDMTVEHRAEASRA